MKKLILASILAVTPWFSYSAVPVAEAPINGYGTPTSVAVSSTTLTKVPTSQTSGRMGIFISNPSNASALPVTGFYGNCTSNSVAVTVRPIEIVSSSTTITNRYFSMREDVCLWLLSQDPSAASKSIFYQEVKQ